MTQFIKYNKEHYGRLKSWANWDRASASVGASSKDRDQDDFNGQMLFSDVFSNKLGISNYMPTGKTDKTSLLCDDRRPCLSLGLPPYTIIT
ncbi:hypothetical protein TNCV_3284271 [Trichonephila clavipes]|nr:hypothetical protein TNCV_3284271 [Trichonephila clavipes]